MTKTKEKSYDVIIILGGWVFEDKNGVWRTPSFDEEGDGFGTTGDRVRVVAGGFLYKENRGAVFLVTGGRGQLTNLRAPTVASVLENELVREGVPKERIIKEEQSGSTYEQLRACSDLALKNEWKNIGIVSNRYHLPRIRVMIENMPDLETLRGAETISAEDVLIEKAPEMWKIVIENTYTSENMKKRIKLEKQGVSDIKSGKYIFKKRDDIKFRKATMDDAKRLFDWRNDPETRASSIETGTILWGNHISWLEKSLASNNRSILIAEAGGPVGTVRIDIHENGDHELSWTVAPEARGRGMGKQVVRQAVQEYGKSGLIAKIKEENIASEKIAQCAGFFCVRKKDGFSLWEYIPR